jgi:hypothetical protein
MYRKAATGNSNGIVNPCRLQFTAWQVSERLLLLLLTDAHGFLSVGN